MKCSKLFNQIRPRGFQRCGPRGPKGGRGGTCIVPSGTAGGSGRAADEREKEGPTPSDPYSYWKKGELGAQRELGAQAGGPPPR